MISANFLCILIIFLFATSADANVPLHQFEPYGVENGDTEMTRGDDNSSPKMQISTGKFPFFDTLYSALWVNVNGAISFENPIKKYTPICGPAEREFRSIAPFWADIDIRTTGKILYRQTNETAQLSGGVYADVVRAFPNFVGIKLKWMLVVSWINVTHFKDNHCCRNRKRNTFQAIITTDGRHSFAIFNYNELSWTTGDMSGGTDGLGGTPAQAGFDYGDGKHFFLIDSSCSSKILGISNSSNIPFNNGDDHNSTGKWVFRIDHAEIQSAGCSRNSINKGNGADSGQQSRVQVKPEFVYSLKRQSIQIVGPCVEPDLIEAGGLNAFCRFFDSKANTTTVGAKVESKSRALSLFTCRTPLFYTIGRIHFQLLIEIGKASNSTTTTYDGYLQVLDSFSDEVDEENGASSEFNVTFEFGQTRKGDNNSTIMTAAGGMGEEEGSGEEMPGKMDDIGENGGAGNAIVGITFDWNVHKFPANASQMRIGLVGLSDEWNSSWVELPFPDVVVDLQKGNACIGAERIFKFYDDLVLNKLNNTPAAIDNNLDGLFRKMARIKHFAFIAIAYDELNDI